MQIQYEGKTRSFNFGVDRVTGVFLNVFDEDGVPRINFSEFFPFHIRLSKKELDYAVTQEEISTEDYEAILNHSLGEFTVYFEDLFQLNKEAKLSKFLEDYERQGNPGLYVSTLKDYLALVERFNHDEWSFGTVTWLSKNTGDILYVIKNDQS